MFLHAVLVLDLHSILALILLLDLLEAEDDLVWPGGPTLAPGLGGQVFRALGRMEGLKHRRETSPKSAYLEPCDLGDGVTQDIEDKVCIVALCGRDFVCWLHILWFFSFSGQRRGGFVPVLE